MTPARSAPIRTFLDPRVEIYAPTDSLAWYRIIGYRRDGTRAVNTSGGSTIRAAKAKAAEVSRQLKLAREPNRRDPVKTSAADEAEQWLEPLNHRSRGNRPWTQRHVENMRREWDLRILPQLPPKATVADLADKQLWIRILNAAQAANPVAPAHGQRRRRFRALLCGLALAGLTGACTCGCRKPCRGLMRRSGTR